LQMIRKSSVRTIVRGKEMQAVRKWVFMIRRWLLDFRKFQQRYRHTVIILFATKTILLTYTCTSPFFLSQNLPVLKASNDFQMSWQMLVSFFYFLDALAFS